MDKNYVLLLPQTFGLSYFLYLFHKLPFISITRTNISKVLIYSFNTANPKYETFEYDRNHWIVYWILVALGIAIFNGIERMSIGVLGENLTFGVRKDLIRGILYKQLVWFDRE